MRKRNCSTISNEEALNYILGQALKYRKKTILTTVLEAYNYRLAKDYSSDIDVPGANTSSRDGYCLNSALIEYATKDNPVILPLQQAEIHAGHRVEELRKGHCLYIATGGVLPKGADSVVMLEDVETTEDKQSLVFTSPIEKGAYVRLKASEIQKGQVVAKKFDKIDPIVGGKLASAGKTIVEVYAKPTVGIITSGDEIVMPWQTPEPWQVRTSNPVVMCLLARQHGCHYLDYGVAKDTGNEIEKLFEEAVSECDIVVTSGGIAMGRRDPVRNLFEQLGLKSIFNEYGSHFRPVFFTEYKKKPIFALPGTPEGMYRIFDKFVGPFLDQF